MHRTQRRIFLALAINILASLLDRSLLSSLLGALVAAHTNREFTIVDARSTKAMQIMTGTKIWKLSASLLVSPNANVSSTITRITARLNQVVSRSYPIRAVIPNITSLLPKGAVFAVDRILWGRSELLRRNEATPDSLSLGERNSGSLPIFLCGFAALREDSQLKTRIRPTPCLFSSQLSSNYRFCSAFGQMLSRAQSRRVRPRV